jgi:anti-sigma regulatory factor (Ser/Thr protein kinase)
VIRQEVCAVAEDGVRVVRAHLPGQPSSVTAARHLVRSAAGRMLLDDDLDTVELLVSELVTNAVVHAGTTVDLTMSLRGDTTLRVEVADGSAQLPTSRHYEATASTGRGLSLLGQLAERWGADLTVSGKTVWFLLPLTGGSPGRRARPAVASDPATETASPEDVVHVELLDVPLVLHTAWQEQAEALLRDYLLATLDDKDPDAQILAHADCSDAVALLAEHIPAPDEPTEEVLRPRTVVPVPCSSVPHFGTLDETLQRAIELAAAGGLLAPVSPPAERRLRQWMCRQVAVQAAGQPPSPWQPDA